jgi:hypothetical protein
VTAVRADPSTTARLGAALAAVLMATACADSGGPTADPVIFDSATPSATPSVSEPPTDEPIDPRTVLPLAGSVGGDAALRARPAVATVVRFVPGGAPPLGLGTADLVYQEPARRPGSRLIVLHHSQDSPRVGPIGDTQPADGLLLSLVRPVYVFGGGTERLRTALAKYGLAEVTTGRAGAGFTTAAGGRYAPTAALRAATPPGAGTPVRLLTYGEPGQPVSENPSTTVRTVTITVPGQPAQVWNRDASGGWAQTGPGGPRITVKNLLVAQTVYRDLRTDKAGTLVAEPNLLGGGPLTAVSGDKLVKGSWKRATSKSVATYADGDGVPLRLSPGRSWIVLAPAGTIAVGR